MNIKYTRHMNLLRRAIGIGTYYVLLPLLALFMLKALLFKCTSYGGWCVSADVETVRSSSKAEPHASAGVITPNDWTYTALQTLIKRCYYRYTWFCF